jgi:hypothetical protein
MATSPGTHGDRQSAMATAPHGRGDRTRPMATAQRLSRPLGGHRPRKHGKISPSSVAMRVQRSPSRVTGRHRPTDRSPCHATGRHHPTEQSPCHATGRHHPTARSPCQATSRHHPTDRSPYGATGRHHPTERSAEAPHADSARRRGGHRAASRPDRVAGCVECRHCRRSADRSSARMGGSAPRAGSPGPEICVHSRWTSSRQVGHTADACPVSKFTPACPEIHSDAPRAPHFAHSLMHRLGLTDRSAEPNFASQGSPGSGPSAASGEGGRTARRPGTCRSQTSGG